MRILSNLNISGFLDIDTINNAAADTDKFLVADANGVVKFRTGTEVASDIGASVGYVSTVKHEVKLGEAIAKGQAVYVTSSDGTNMIVSKASNATDVTSSKTLGLLETGGAANAKVFVIAEGLLAGLDTSTATAGAPVWLGTDGNLLYGLGTKPVAPAHMVFIGIVTRVNANNGEIFVKVQNGFELEELHNVLITGTPVDKAVIQYDTATGLWKNSTIGGVTGSGVTGQVAYWNGTNTQTGSNNLFWDATNNRFGIGTNTPSAELHIEKTSSPVFRIARTGGTILNISSSITATGAQISTGSLSPINFGINGIIAMTLSDSSNLLIGTTVDTGTGQKLQVTGTSLFTDSATFTKAYVNTSDLGVIVSATIPGINLRTPTSGRISLISNYNSANSASIVTGTGTNNPTALQMLFDFTNLRVGIGTPTPNTKLDVLGAASVAGGTEGLRIGNLGDNSSYDNVKIYYTGFNAGAPRVYLTPRTTPGSGIVESFFHIQNSNGASTTSNNTMGLLVDGSVGIGTTAPAYKLEVHGVIRSSTDIISSGSFRTSTYDYLAGRTASRIEVYSSALNVTDRVMDFGDETRGWTITSMQNGANVAELGFNYRGADTLTQSVRFNLHAPLIGGSILQVPFAGVSFAPTSGATAFNTILSSPTINQVGATGVTRAILIQPTLTAAADWRSIEWTNATGWGLYGSGASNNYLAGSLGIATTTLTGVTLAIAYDGSAKTAIKLTQSSSLYPSYNIINAVTNTIRSGSNTVTGVTISLTELTTAAIGRAISINGDVNGGESIDNRGGIIGVQGSAGVTTAHAVGHNYGVVGTASNTATNSFGVLATLGSIGNFAGRAAFMAASGADSDVAYFRNSSSFVMAIKSTGDVGIGTTSPTSKLDVTGSSSSTYIASFSQTNVTADTSFGLLVRGGTSANDVAFRVQNAAASSNLLSLFGNGLLRLGAYGTGARTGTVAYNLAVDASGNIIETAGGVVDGSGTANYVPRWQDANTLTNSTLLQGTRSLGLNTATPVDFGTGTYNLHLHDDGIPLIHLTNSTTGQTTTSGMRIQANGNDLVFINSQATGIVRWLLNGSERVRITATGNVGIGTSTPAYSLDVNGSIRIPNSSYIYINNVAGTAIQSIFMDAGDNLVINTSTGGDVYLRTGGNTVFRALSNGDINIGGLSATSSPLFKILNNGNVGVGTTTPAYKLDVTGTARVTGDITGDSNLILGTLGGADTTIRINGHNTAYSTIDSNAGYNSAYNGLMIRSNANNGNSGADWQLDLGGRDITFGQDHFVISRLASGGSNTQFLRINNTGAATFTSSVTATRGLFGTTTFNGSAVLQADSTTQGFLPPRMTAAQRAAISTPAIGLTVYQTDGTEGLYIYTNASGWKSLAIVN